MSKTSDLVWGHGRDQLLDKMLQELPDLELNQGNATHELAALVWLDQAQGLAQEGDYVLLHASIGIWVLMDVEIENPIIADLVNYEPEPEADAERAGKDLEQAASRPFKIKFGDDAPANIKSQTLSVAIMKEDEELPGNESFGITVRADGTFISAEKSLKRQSV